VREITDGVHGVMPHSLDPAVAKQLWDVSVELITEKSQQPKAGA
jgi:hypothetical protein